MIYNIVLVSGIQQRELHIHLCISTIFKIFFYRIGHYRVLSRVPCIMGFPGGSAGKESAHNARTLGSILGLGRSPGEEKGYPLHYSGLENSMDCIVHGVAKSRTRLSDSHSPCAVQ